MTDSNVNHYGGADVTSSGLLARAKQDDSEAWERIVDYYGEVVFRWCRASGLRPEAARDVGQDVFMAAYRGLKNFSPQREVGSFRAWLRRITRSKLADHWKKNSLESAGGSDVKERLEQVEFPEDDPSSAAEDLKLLYHQVEQYIRGNFSEQHCEAFFCVAMRGEAPSEVAARLGITRNVVYLACARIKKRVRDEFGDLLGDEDAL